MADDLSAAMKKLRSIERKLDVLIEAQHLQGQLADREAADREAGAAKTNQTAEAFRRASGGR
jgi:hypothetical protein